MRSRKGARREEADVDLLKGAVAGLIAGFVASWTMNQFQAAWSKVEAGVEKPHGAQGLKPYREGQSSLSLDDEQRPGRVDEEDDDPTEKVAEAISETVFEQRLDEREKHEAGRIVHYAYGALTGVMYGAAAEVLPLVKTGEGLPFGAAVWLFADEITVPALGLSKKPTEYPLSTHLYSLSSHFVYGLTTELVRRTIREALEKQGGMKGGQ